MIHQSSEKFVSEIDKNWKLLGDEIGQQLDQKLTTLFSQNGTANSISERYSLITDTVFEV